MKYSKMCLVVEINVRDGYILYNFPHNGNVPSLSRNLHTEQCNLCHLGCILQRSHSACDWSDKSP